MPEGGTCVPYRLDSVGRGRIMTVPVHIGGNVRDFVFDTGAAQFNFVSERFARENGIRMIADSIPGRGYRPGVGRTRRGRQPRRGRYRDAKPRFSDISARPGDGHHRGHQRGARQRLHAQGGALHHRQPHTAHRLSCRTDAARGRNGKDGEHDAEQHSSPTSVSMRTVSPCCSISIRAT